MFKPLTDKPGSITHEYRGVTLRIAFRYPDESCVPNGVLISPERQPDPSSLGKQNLVVYDLFEGNWETYGDAEEAAIERVEAFIDANWIDQ